MADKFLGVSSGGANLSNGTANIFSSTLGASSLDPSKAIKTNSVRQLVSSNLSINDVDTLQTQLSQKDELTFIKDDTANATPPVGSIKIYAKSDGSLYKLDELGNELVLGSGGGDVSGPISATDNHIVIYDGVSGKLIKEVAGYRYDDINNTLVVPDIETSTTFSLNQELADKIDKDGSVAMEGDLNLGNFTLNNVGTGALPTDGINLAQLDTEVLARINEDLTFYKLDGSRPLTSFMDVNNNPIINLPPAQPPDSSSATSKGYVDGEISTSASNLQTAITANTNAISTETTNRTNEDLTFYKLDGSRPLTSFMDVNNNPIINLPSAQPPNSSSATSKGYVDGEITTSASNLQTSITANTNAISTETTNRTNEDLTFVKLDGSRPMTSNLNLASNKIINVANGVDPTDAINLSQYAAGLLDEQNFRIASDNSLQTNIDNEATARTNEDLTFLKLDGSRALTGILNLSSNKIINVANGVLPTDAINLSQLQTSSGNTTIQAVYDNTAQPKNIVLEPLAQGGLSLQTQITATPTHPAFLLVNDVGVPKYILQNDGKIITTNTQELQGNAEIIIRPDVPIDNLLQLRRNLTADKTTLSFEDIGNILFEVGCKANSTDFTIDNPNLGGTAFTIDSSNNLISISDMTATGTITTETTKTTFLESPLPLGNIILNSPIYNTTVAPGNTLLGTGGANIDLVSGRILNLAPSVNPTDAVNGQQLLDETTARVNAINTKLSLDGSTPMIGDLNMNSRNVNGVNAIIAINGTYTGTVIANSIGSILEMIPTSYFQSVDTPILTSTGGTITIQRPLDLFTQTISNVSTLTVNDKIVSNQTTPFTGTDCITKGHLSTIIEESPPTGGNTTYNPVVVPQFTTGNTEGAFTASGSSFYDADRTYWKAFDETLSVPGGGSTQENRWVSGLLYDGSGNYTGSTQTTFRNTSNVDEIVSGEYIELSFGAIYGLEEIAITIDPDNDGLGTLAKPTRVVFLGQRDGVWYELFRELNTDIVYDIDLNPTVGVNDTFKATFTAGAYDAIRVVCNKTNTQVYASITQITITGTTVIEVAPQAIDFNIKGAIGIDGGIVARDSNNNQIIQDLSIDAYAMVASTGLTANATFASGSNEVWVVYNEFDTFNSFNALTSASNITISHDGTYKIIFSTSILATNSQLFCVAIFNAGLLQFCKLVSASNRYEVSGVCLCDCVAGDTIELRYGRTTTEPAGGNNQAVDIEVKHTSIVVEKLKKNTSY